MMDKDALLAVALGLGAWWYFSNRTTDQGDGVSSLIRTDLRRGARIGGAVVQTESGSRFVETQELIGVLDLTNPDRNTTPLGRLAPGTLLTDPALSYTDFKLRNAIESGQAVTGL